MCASMPTIATHEAGGRELDIGGMNIEKAVLSTGPTVERGRASLISSQVAPSLEAF